ncbi:hypothetical protein L1887_14305 [Cichorium endivia]|nr:hypothetical protein L1887_14305 [Cichorium endivia]
MIGASEGKSFKGCVRCMCWCCCLLFLLIAIAIGFAYYIYTTEKPKAPTYDIQSFTVKSLDLQDDLIVKTEFVVDVKTKNPNTNIGFVYEERSNVSILYNDAIISSGKLPAFKQDPGNTTIMKIALAGSNLNVSSSFQDDVKNSNDDQGIPLAVIVKVMMRVYVGNVDLKEFIAFVTCGLIVENLESGRAAKVLLDECEADVEF